VIIPAERIKMSDYFEDKGIEVFENIKAMNLEGMIAKRKYSNYTRNKVYRLAKGQEHKNSGLHSNRIYQRRRK
jgi:ATP-dependent DNA ligase